MIAERRVFLDGIPVGTLRQTRQGALGFTYDADHLHHRDPTPLSLSLPLRSGDHPNRPVRAFLEGLLPDSPAVRQRWGTTFGASPHNPFALLTHVGRDAAGAVQVLTTGEASTDAERHQGNIERLTESDLLSLGGDSNEPL